MALEQGTSLVWNNPVTSITNFAAVGSSTNAFSSSDLSLEADEKLVTNGYGNVISQRYTNYRKVVNLKCFPAGSGANPVALPVVGEKCTVMTATGDTEAGTGWGSNYGLGGDYVATAVSKTRSGEGHCEFDITLTRYEYVAPA